MTADTESNINIWNLEKETCKQLPRLSRKDLPSNWPKGVIERKPIVDIKEIPQYKVIAVCSLDKLIVLWDIVKCRCVLAIPLETVSVHSLTYSVDFRVMFTAGYENHINIWSFDKTD